MVQTRKDEARRNLKAAKEAVKAGMIRFDPDYLSIKRRCKSVLLDKEDV